MGNTSGCEGQVVPRAAGSVGGGAAVVVVGGGWHFREEANNGEGEQFCSCLS
jgi:hypothetical protein